MNMVKIIPEMIGLIDSKKLPRKKPKRMFRMITWNFVFLPVENIRKTTAAIQKNARITAMISCL